MNPPRLQLYFQIPREEIPTAGRQKQLQGPMSVSAPALFLFFHQLPQDSVQLRELLL